MFIYLFIEFINQHSSTKVQSHGSTK